MPRLLERVQGLLRQGRRQEAEQLLLELMDSPEDGVAAIEVLATMWADEGRVAEALEAVESQIARTDRAPARLHRLLADIYRSRGRLSEAYREYARALELDPTCSVAALALTEAGDDQAKQRLVGQLLSTLDGIREDGPCKSELHFAVAAIYNNLGEYARAFDHYRQANASTGKPMRYSFNADFVSDSKLLFSRKFFKSIKDSGSTSRLPMFIVGMPRSGTTLLEQMLNRHTKISGMGELLDVATIAGAIAPANRSGQAFPGSMRLLTKEQSGEFGSRYVGKLKARIGDGDITRAIDKNPLNFRYAGLINVILPRARIIHIERHPLDTCLSCYFQAFFSQELSFSNSLQHCADYYLNYRELMKHWERVLPTRMLSVNYRSLVEKPEQTLRRVVEFIGLAWDEQCLDSTLQDSTIRTASVVQARQDIYQSSVDRWKHYAPDIAPLQDRLAKYL